MSWVIGFAGIPAAIRRAGLDRASCWQWGSANRARRPLRLMRGIEHLGCMGAQVALQY
jgi:hypothetical protein